MRRTPNWKCLQNNLMPDFTCYTQVLFEGVMGFHYHSDIAIDNLQMHKGQCETQGVIPSDAMADPNGNEV